MLPTIVGPIAQLIKLAERASTCAGAKKATDEFVELHGLTVIDNYYIIKE
jgi:hypothetical protein